MIVAVRRKLIRDAYSARHPGVVRSTLDTRRPGPTTSRGVGLDFEKRLVFLCFALQGTVLSLAGGSYKKPVAVGPGLRRDDEKRDSDARILRAGLGRKSHLCLCVLDARGELFRDPCIAKGNGEQNWPRFYDQHQLRTVPDDGGLAVTSSHCARVRSGRYRRGRRPWRRNLGRLGHVREQR
jgi:hypothetical protein